MDAALALPFPSGYRRGALPLPFESRRAKLTPALTGWPSSLGQAHAATGPAEMRARVRSPKARPPQRPQPSVSIQCPFSIPQVSVFLTCGLVDELPCNCLPARICFVSTFTSQRISQDNGRVSQQHGIGRLKFSYLAGLRIFILCAFRSTRDKERVTGFRYPDTPPKGYASSYYNFMLGSG